MKKIHYLDTIISPNVTEKSTSLSEFNKVVFKVHKGANKNTIKKNIEIKRIFININSIKFNCEINKTRTNNTSYSCNRLNFFYLHIFDSFHHFFHLLWK